MIRIDMPQQLPPELQDWQGIARNITAEILAATSIQECHSLIERNKRHWRKSELVNWLSGLAFDKCWYTETFFGGDYQEVEHFRPKKLTKGADGKAVPNHLGYYWLAFEVSNYRLCKSRPNRKKGTFFPILNERLRACNESESWEDEAPLFLDPTKSGDVLLLSFDDNGKPIPDAMANVSDARRAQFTIDKFFLDERVLNGRRQQKWAAVRVLYHSYLHDLKAVNVTNSVAKRATAETKLKDLIAMGARESEFSSVARESLLKLGDPAAMKIVSSM